MSSNRGKQFEDVIKKAFEKVPNTTVIRLHDQMNGYLGSANICDFVIYHYPHQFLIECKTIHGNTFPLANISKHQWEGLLEVESIKGVVAGVLVWWVDKDATMFLPIKELQKLKQQDKKSVRYDLKNSKFIQIYGKKKRVFFDYDIAEFIAEVKYRGV